jgi:glycosyltransferase involved in cell wall biosynthesis
MVEKKIRSLQLISVRWWNATAYYGVILAKILNRNNYFSMICGQKNSPPIIQAKYFSIPLKDTVDMESKNPFMLLRSFIKIKNIIHDYKLGILNAHRPEDHFFGALLRRKNYLPLIRTIGDVREPKINPVNKWLHLYLTDFFIFSSFANQRRYQNVWPIPNEKCAVIYAPVDTNYFKPRNTLTEIRKKLGISIDKIVFGLVARLSPVKDHITFLKSAALILKKYGNAEFIVSGKAVEITHKDLVEKSRELGIKQNIHILDEMTDVRDIIDSIDIGVVCSKGSEAICRIAAEFLAMSKPIILTQINVLPEMITNGIEGFLVPPESPSQLANKMELFLVNSKLQNKMGVNARLTAEIKFSQNKMLEDTLNVYKNLIRSGRSDDPNTKSVNQPHRAQ